MAATVAAFVALRWRLLRGSIRMGGGEQVGAIVSIVFSAVIGVGASLVVFVAGRRTDELLVLTTLACTFVLIAALGFGIVAGIAQPIDPRVVAAEPMRDSDRTAGLLAAAAFGPPGLAGIALGVGLVAGSVRSVGDLPAITAAAISWLLSLLLVARTATNLLAMFASRFPRTGQLVVGVAGLAFYGMFQFVPALLTRLDVSGRARLADVLAWSPPGQVGRALQGGVGAWLHVVMASAWLPALAVAFAWSTRELSLSVRRAGGFDTNERGPIGRAARWACGSGVRGTIAWRSILVRFRSPRTALETVTGAGVGLAAVLAPVILQDEPGSGAVLVGGAVQLSVLFLAGNSFGTDGPAITHELLTGVDARTYVAGKARSIVVVAAPLAVIGPLLAAIITGEWSLLGAGFCVGIGGLLAGTGAAVVQSVMVPIAIPESDNPFAGGESGKGLLAALLLVVVLAVLAVVTIPVALALLWAVDRERLALVMFFSIAAIAVGWFVLRAGTSMAARRLEQHESEFIASITPAR